MRLATFSLVAGIAAAGALADGAETPQELLRESDVSTFAPQAFQARLKLASPGTEPLNLEVWRSAENQTLVRFLDAKDQGKYLLKRDGAVWFLSPRASKPVKLNPSYRLFGAASLDEILGTRYSREYRVVGVSEVEGLAALDLQASGRDAPYPRVAYFVQRETRRPVRIEFRATNGTVIGSVAFLEWEEGTTPPRPRRLQVTDALHGKTPVAVEILEVNEKLVPEALFDLENGTARKALESVPSSKR